MESRRLGTTLAAAALLAALGACSKEPDARTQQSVGTKIDRAIDRTQEQLERAGEKAKAEIAEATGKTQEALSKAGDRISETASNAIGEAKRSAPGSAPAGDPPFAPRQPADTAAAAAPASPAPPPAAAAAAPASTMTALSTGPATSVKSTGFAKETRATLGDAAITASIKADFLKDPDLSVLKIDVDTRDGVVTLNGLAENEAAKTRAERMAQAVKGVKEVRNYLTIKRA